MMDQGRLPANSKFIEIKNSRLHYYEQGKGDPILFLHGMPTSSYLWRNIIPYFANNARCIAPDLIGMGDSDKPNIDYRVFEHIEYIEKFIEALQLENITLVMHGWGSAIGFEVARRQENKIKALAFYEAHLVPVTDKKMLSLPVQQFASLLSRPGASYRAVVQQNYLVNKLLSSATITPLSAEILEEYRRPFPTAESRKPLWQYIQDLPLGDGPADVVELMTKYSQWLETTSIPKLLIYAIPGFFTTMGNVHWAKDHLKNLTLIALDNVLHFAQESAPQAFGQALSDWYSAVNLVSDKAQTKERT